VARTISQFEIIGLRSGRQHQASRLCAADVARCTREWLVVLQEAVELSAKPIPASHGPGSLATKKFILVALDQSRSPLIS